MDVVLFLWNTVKAVVQGDDMQNTTFTYSVEKIDNFEKVCIQNTKFYCHCLLTLCS